MADCRMRSCIHDRMRLIDVAGHTSFKRHRLPVLCVTSLICTTLLFPKSTAQSVGQNQRPSVTIKLQPKPPATASNEPLPIPPEWNMLTKVCGPKNPAPCATAPLTISAPPPSYSEEARRANYQGVCVLGVIVDADGQPKDIRVLMSLGMGLDEEAIKAVGKWKFKPAMMDGKPVKVAIQVEVAFHLSAGGGQTVPAPSPR